jgi:hypothetical protein
MEGDVIISPSFKQDHWTHLLRLKQCTSNSGMITGLDAEGPKVPCFEGNNTDQKVCIVRENEILFRNYLIAPHRSRLFPPGPQNVKVTEQVTLLTKDQQE